LNNNNYKENDIGKIPNEWENLNFLDCLSPDKFEEKEHLQQNKYPIKGKYPIIDQGAALIAGFTNNEDLVHNEGLPVVIFGDHTRIFKYVDFPFVLGADGTKVLKPKENRIDGKFFYFCLLNLDLPSKGYSRHFKYLKEKQIICPPLSEQRTIAAILFNIQQAIEVQEKIIERAKELKKSLIAKLFTEGLHGEELKETEIGWMPNSWEVKKLIDIATLQRGKDLPAQNWKKGSYPIVGSNGIIGYHNEYFLDGAGVVTGRSGSIGKLSYIEGKYWAHNTTLYVKDFHSNYPKCIYYLLHRLDFRKYVTGVSVPTLNRNFIHPALLPLPSFEEQKEIVSVLDKVALKISNSETKRNTMKNLFKTMLHQLMTGTIRLNNIELTAP
jgi:type I restriction enzyme S subunit